MACHNTTGPCTFCAASIYLYRHTHPSLARPATRLPQEWRPLPQPSSALPPDVAKLPADAGNVNDVSSAALGSPALPQTHAGIVRHWAQPAMPSTLDRITSQASLKEFTDLLKLGPDDTDIREGAHRDTAEDSTPSDSLNTREKWSISRLLRTSASRMGRVVNT